MLFHVVAITIFLLLYNNEISDQICIDFSAENGLKLPVAAAKASCNALSAITELPPFLNLLLVLPKLLHSISIKYLSFSLNKHEQ